MTDPTTAPQQDHLTWSAWLADNPHAPEQDKLDALREYIFEAAQTAVADEPDKITPAWLNKKLGPLGVVKRIPTDGNMYQLKVPVNVDPVQLTIYAGTRDEAIKRFMSMVSGARVTGAEAASDPEFVSGPEDEDPTAFNPDAPTTVADTLAALREAIMLAVIAGPRICADGANGTLATFNLDPIPTRREYVVTRPAEATFRTVVTAYDEASAQRVAEWRWTDGRSGFTVAETADAGDFATDVN